MNDRLAMARAAYERLTLYDPQRAPVELDLTDNTNLWGMPPAAERALRETAVASVTRYPSLLTKPLPIGVVAGWERQFNWTGLPFAWTPLTSAEVAGMKADQPRITEVNAGIERRERSKTLAVSRRGSWTPGKDLEMALQLLFGLR